MARKKQIRARNCLHCGEAFAPNPKTASRQRFCSKAICQRASHAKSQARWLATSGNDRYFCGVENTSRVRAWRAHHPKYWQRLRGAPDPLPDVRPKLLRVLREAALQDVMAPHLALAIGLLSHLLGSALQDEIAGEIRRLMLVGRGVLATTAPTVIDPKFRSRSYP